MEEEEVGMRGEEEQVAMVAKTVAMVAEVARMAK